MIEKQSAPNPTFRGVVITPDDGSSSIGHVRLSTDILNVTTRHDHDLSVGLSIDGPRGASIAWLDLSEAELRGLHGFLSELLAEVGTMRAYPSYIERLRTQVAEYSARYTGQEA